MNTPKIEVSQNPNAISRISAGMNIIQGEITLEHDIRIDGNFDGKITSLARIIVGETANVKGEVICSNLDIWGKLDGNAIVKDTITMKTGCLISANVNIGNIIIESGAKFNGTTKIIDENGFNEMCKDNEFIKSTKKEGHSFTSSNNEFKPAAAASPAPAPAADAKKPAFPNIEVIK